MRAWWHEVSDTKHVLLLHNCYVQKERVEWSRELVGHLLRWALGTVVGQLFWRSYALSLCERWACLSKPAMFLAKDFRQCFFSMFLYFVRGNGGQSGIGLRFVAQSERRHLFVQGFGKPQ